MIFSNIESLLVKRYLNIADERLKICTVFSCQAVDRMNQ